MKTRNLSTDEAMALALKEEGHFYDRKSNSVSGRKLQKIAVAFANSDGGEIIIGIADDEDEANPEKRWNGFSNLEAANGLLQALFSLQPTVPLKYEILSSPFSGYAIRIIIEKSGQVHKTSDDNVYIRFGAQSLPINDPQKIVELSFAKGASSFEDTILPAVKPETIVDSPILKTFLGGYSPKTDPLDYAVNQNILDANSWFPKVAAVVLFSEFPSANMPTKCSAKVVRYETKENDPERDHLKDVYSLEGPLYDLIHSTVNKVTEVMSSVSVWTSKGLGKAAYPPEAIWEVVVNAFIHRDYSISDDVQIKIFDNRIEVRSPGRLPGYVNMQNILDARYSRNPKIVRTLNWYPAPPNKDLGEGLNTAFQKMKEWGLKNPEIYEDGNYVVVILPHTPLATPSDAILEFLRSNQSITNSQARDITGIRSENLVKIEFYKLRDEGYIERVPGLEGPKSAWQLTNKGKQYIACL